MLPVLFLSVGGCADGLRPVSHYARMADGDVAKAVSTMQAVLMDGRDGDTAEWRNEATAMRGAITPLRTFLTSNGYFCRTYREDLWAAGTRQSYMNTACLNDEGRWVWAEGLDDE